MITLGCRGNVGKIPNNYLILYEVSSKQLGIKASFLSSLVKMSEAIYDPCAYTRLNDSVVHQILVSSDPKLEEVSCV